MPLVKRQSEAENANLGQPRAKHLQHCNKQRHADTLKLAYMQKFIIFVCRMNKLWENSHTNIYLYIYIHICLHTHIYYSKAFWEPGAGVFLEDNNNSKMKSRRSGSVITSKQGSRGVVACSTPPSLMMDMHKHTAIGVHTYVYVHTCIFRCAILICFHFCLLPLLLHLFL